MDWKQIGLNIIIVGFVYIIFYSSSFCFSKKHVEKRKEELKDGKEKHKK